MKTIKLFVLATCCLFITQNLLSQVNKEERKIESFSGLDVSVPVKLIISQGNTASLVIEGSAKDISKIVTEVKNGNLKIKRDNESNHKFDEVTIYLSNKSFESISHAGSGEIISKGPIKEDNLEVSMAGSGDIILDDLTSNHVEISLAGSGDVILKGSGKASNLEVSIAGSGDVNADSFEVESMEVSIAGSGDCKVFVTQKLEASIVGSGDVVYKGEPRIEVSSIGSGKVEKM